MGLTSCTSAQASRLGCRGLRIAFSLLLCPVLPSPRARTASRAAADQSGTGRCGSEFTSCHGGPREGVLRALWTLSCSGVHTLRLGRLWASAWLSPVVRNFGGHGDILRDIFLVLTHLGQKELHPFSGSYYLPQTVLLPAPVQLYQLFLVSDCPRAETPLTPSSGSSLPTCMFVRGSPNWCLYPGVSFILHQSNPMRHRISQGLIDLPSYGSPQWARNMGQDLDLYSGQQGALRLKPQGDRAGPKESQSACIFLSPSCTPEAQQLGPCHIMGTSLGRSTLSPGGIWGTDGGKEGEWDHWGHDSSFPPGQAGSSLGEPCGDMHGHMGTQVLAEQGGEP